ncbi:NAD(P)-binding protein [Piedraia hortae CBS 480.64]|uniref:NAD(P)-binding protein n=1 Tax=Piedraia hortae CBS 480.64 TaxID=1314780 RepID=A0A6A7BYP1_9PEZI|nr:NAD(P)-binding protein [Piedraia hortae CBS 480.64]
MPKTVILTGASRGIGRAMAQFLLQQKHRLVLVAQTEAPLKELEHQYPEQVAVQTGDLSNFYLANKVVNLAKDRFGQVDGLLVNHAVLEPVGRIADASVEAWRRAFDINFFSAIPLIQAALPELRKTKGCIVLVSSGAASNAYAAWGAYGSAKAALNHLAMTLANEESLVTTIAVRPGVVDTNMQKDIRDKHHHHMNEKDAARFKELNETGRLLKPEEPGHVMARMVVDAPKELTGKFMSWDAEALKAYQA